MPGNVGAIARFFVEFPSLLLSVENSPSNCDCFWGEGQEDKVYPEEVEPSGFYHVAAEIEHDNILKIDLRVS